MFKYYVNLFPPFLYLHVCERGHDEGTNPRAANGDAGDEGPLLIKVLCDAVKPGEVDDAQPQPQQPPSSEVEEEDAGSHRTQT